MITEVLYTKPSFVKMTDDYWAIDDEFCADLKTDEDGGVFQFTIKSGFMFNFRSGPGAIDSFVPKIDDGWLGYVIHDALYEDHCGLSRKTADTIMYDIHRMCGLGWARSWIAYKAVRAFGQSAWEEEDERQKEKVAMNWAPGNRRLMWFGKEKTSP